METEIIECYEKEYNYAFFCRYCHKEHRHGKVEGGRVAHCTNEKSPYLKTGYILKLEKRRR